LQVAHPPPPLHTLALPVNPFRLILLAGALLLLEALIGGTRLVFALPGFALIALAALTQVAGRREGLAQPKWYCAVTTFLVFGWVVFRAYTSPVPYLARPDLYQVIACLLMYGAFAWFCTQPRERIWIFGFLLLLGVIQVFIGIRQFKYGDDWMPFHLARTPYGHRASGFFVHPIYFAGYLEAVGIIGVSLACWARWRMEARVATGFAALLCYLGVAISGSRGGYLSVAVSVVAFFVLSLWMLARMDRRRFVITLIAGLIGLVLAGSVATTVMSRSNLLRARIAMLNAQWTSASTTGRRRSTSSASRPSSAPAAVRTSTWDASSGGRKSSPTRSMPIATISSCWRNTARLAAA
jgi:O-antigen ligase